MKRVLLLAALLLLYLLPSSAQLTYPDVAGIFYQRCTMCHHDGQRQPSFLTFSQLSPNCSKIKLYLENNIMPPWPPDTTYSRFLNERIITAEQKATIIDWVNDGCLAGDTSLAPAPPVYDSQYKLRGTPSLVLQIPTFTSNAGSADAYNCFSLPTGLTEDVWLRAFELVPGNQPIVHHVVVQVDSTGTVTSDLSGGCYNQPGDFAIGVWAPGAAPTIFPGVAPLKAGIRLKAGSRINLQIHYPKGTAGQQDSTQIRLYFYPAGTTGIRPMTVTTPLQNWTFAIPANTVQTVTASYNVSQDISIYAAFPHAHMVCTSITNYADKSGSPTIPLIRINKWNFEWQGFYTYRNLVKVSSGYTLRASHVYDNTINNPNNPHNPPQLVTAGTRTHDEMLFDSFQFLAYQPGDESIDIGKLLENDSLLTGVTPVVTASVKVYEVYPNPVKDVLMVDYSVNTSGMGMVFSIWDMEGRMLKQVKSVSTRGLNKQAISVADLSPGVYILQIHDGGAKQAVKFVTGY